MASTNVRVAYRPVRVGFLLRAGSLDDVRAAARLATVLWGGVYHALLPVENVERARQLVARFRPDILHPVVADERLAEVVAACPYLAWPRNLEYFEGFEPHEGELPFLDVRPAMGAIYAELRLQRASPWVRPTWDNGEFAPLLGAYLASTRTEISWSGTCVRFAPASSTLVSCRRASTGHGRHLA